MARRHDASTTEVYAAGVKTEVETARVRADVASWQTELEQRGLIAWGRGNVSGKVPSAPQFVIASDAARIDKAAPEKTVLCDFDGVPAPGALGSDLAPSRETALHAALYRRLPALAAVIHADALFATAWALRDEPLPSLTLAAAEEFGGSLPLVPLVDDLGVLGDRIADVIEADGASTVLVPGYGVVATGDAVATAARRLVLAESTARVAIVAGADGRGPQLDPLVLDALVARATIADEPMS